MSRWPAFVALVALFVGLFSGCQQGRRAPVDLIEITVISPASTVAIGFAVSLRARGWYRDGSSRDLTTAVTWSSSATGVATVSNAGGSAGLASSVAAGATTMTATHVGSAVFGTTTLTVTAAVLVSIAVTPSAPSIALGTTQQFTATGTFSDTSTQDLTAAVTWSSSATGVATVSNAGGSEGLASSAAAGAATITATHVGSAVFGTTTLTVIDGISFRAASSAGVSNGVLTLTLAKPNGTVAGDVMVAAIVVRPETATITSPNGWTLVRRVNNAATTPSALAVYVRVAAGGEPGSWDWTFSSSSGSAGGIATFLGVDTTSPVHVESGQNTASGLTHATPSVNVTAADAMVFTAHAFTSSASWIPPAGMTEAFDVANTASANASGVSLEGNHELLAAIGATGARTATAASHADAGNAVIVVLLPSP